MKVNDTEKKTLSVAIDNLNEGIDTFIQLYNEAEDDRPLIVFEEDTIHIIEKAKEAYGTEKIDERINNIIREILSLLPIDSSSLHKDSTK